MDILKFIKIISEDEAVWEGIIKILEPKIDPLLKRYIQGNHDSTLILPEEDLISINDTLKLTTPPIGRTTLYNWTKARKIKAYNVGRRVFYSKKSILTFLTSVEKKPPKNQLNLKNDLKVKTTKTKVTSDCEDYT